MTEQERPEELRPGAPVFSVAPVKSPHRLPRGVLAALVVGVVAFVGGLAVASSGPAPVARPGQAPVASGAAGVAAPDAPGGSSPPRLGGLDGSRSPNPPSHSPQASLPPPGSSSFLAGFRPAALIAAVEGGAACTTGEPLQKEVPRTRADGPRLTVQRSWMAWCPVPEERRQAFLVHVIERLVQAVPADTFGYSATGGGAGDALFPYAERPLAGTVALTADAAGGGLAIAIVVEEWRLDTAP